jgi:uncharacterized protein
MQLIDGRYLYSATDLDNDLECRFLTVLNEAVARRELVRPERDATAKLIAEKGELHERRYLETMRAVHGADLTEFPSRVGRSLAEMQAADDATLEAMARGTKFIYQATFFDGQFLGRTDFLRRVETPSARWPWSYEVLDTKLAMSAKPYYVLQLCNYSEQLERLQGTRPEFGYVILGSGEEQRFRIDDFFAYYAHRKAAFLAERAAPGGDPYPDETAHCTVCEWATSCERRRVADDHLSLVAWMRSDQIDKLKTAGITKVAQLANAAPGERPTGMTPRTFDALRAQARLQHRQQLAIDAGMRDGRQYSYEFIERDPSYGDARYGLEWLPQPDNGDIFFDMEGDPLYAPGQSLEYLFGAYLPLEKEYVPFWATSVRDERAAVEAFIDFVRDRRSRFPGMHVYHYAPYEPSALKRLVGRYATREDELDDLLRGEVFVDLYTVVRQGIRISQPGYSIKQLEPFYGFTRATNTRAGDDSILQFEAWLASGDDAILDDIRRYNEDDCVSTHLLREWLLARRAERIEKTGVAFDWRPQPEPRAPAVDEARSELERELLRDLTPPVSLDALRACDESFRARWLLGNLVEFHRREAKPAWWAIYDRYANVDQLEEFDSDAIGGLALDPRAEPYTLSPRDRTFVYTYTFPKQQFTLSENDKPHCAVMQKPAGTIVAIREDEGRLEIKLPGKVEPDSIRALIPGPPIDTKTQRAALARVAQAYADGSLGERWPAARDLLLARAPRINGLAPGAPVQPPVVSADAIASLAHALDRSYLVVQGPPGSGKSSKGATVIAGLLIAGKRVGILSGGHKAIQHLLEKVEAALRLRGASVRGLYQCSKEAGTERADSMIRWVNDYAAFDAPHELAAGTSWMFSREAFVDRYDYLFIDEAGQTSLADALACAPCASNVVLLGDPLQLKQVSQGSHPIGTDGSVLQHVLGEHHTIPEDRGIFLNVTYRLPPAICSFVSTMVYEHRLRPDDRTGTHGVRSSLINGSGLRYLPVAHAGNRRESVQEAEAITDQIAQLLDGRVSVEGRAERPLSQRDVLIVAPYNAQRKLLRRTLAAAGLGDIRVGTVDKFQGQEAPVVFYSMSTSSDDDMPRDVGFLFEQNRLNVAITRAQCVSILVCSPRLLDVRCGSVEHMRLTNLLCAYVAAAEPLDPANGSAHGLLIA